MSQKVIVEPRHIFSLHREARNCLFFSDEQTIVFPSGNNCVHYNIHLQQVTEFIRGAVPYQEGIRSLAISPDLRYMAVSDCREQGIITVHDIEEKQCFQREVLTGGNISIHEVVCMAFSSDSKYLLCQSGGPEWTLFYWEWKTNEVIATVKITRTGFVSQVSFNPKDNTQICVSGKYVFSSFKLENNSLNKTSSFSMDQENIVSHAWMAEDCIISGTESGKLLLMKDGHWKKLRSPTTRHITAIMPYSKGFACAAGAGIVYLYEKNEEHDYMKTKEIRIPQDPCSNQPEQLEITAMCLSPSEEMLVISTRQGQIYHISLASIENSQSKQANFEVLSQFVYLGSITDLSTCSSKPLFATCSSDNSVCIWNYMTNSLELYKQFPEVLNCISLHSDGLSILMGFSDKVCLMNLLVDEFCIVKEFNIHNCKMCEFNHDGTVFAAVSNNLINICNIRTGEILELDGNMSEVLSVKWSKDDHSLMSCSLDGFVYVWNTVTGTCESQNLQETHIFTDMIFSPNTGTVFGVASSFIINEFRAGQILWEIVSDDMAYTSICMTHSCQAIFIGTAIGTVRVLQYPLEEEKSLTEYQAHSAPITKMVVTPDDQYLLTASEDGSLIIWTITDQKGCKLSMVKETSYPEEDLCTKTYLEEKDQSRLETYTQVNLLNEEQIDEKINTFKQEQQEKIHKLRQNYIQQIEDLSDQIQTLLTEKEEQKASPQKVLTQVMTKHAKELKDEASTEFFFLFSSTETYLHEELEQRMQAMKQNHEEKPCKHEDNHFCTTMDMKRAYDDRLQVQQYKLQHTEEKLKELQEIVESRYKNILFEYSQKLQVEREARMKLENETKLMEKQMMQFWKIKGEIHDQCLGISQLKAEVEEMNSKNKETIYDLNQELKMKEKELCTVRKKVKNMEIFMQGIKADIQTCASYILYPHVLRENFMKFKLHNPTRFGVKALDTTWTEELPEVKSEETQTVMTEHDEICLKYEHELQVEKEISNILKCEMKLMEKQMVQFWKIKGELKDQSLQISMLKDEVQNLNNQYRNGKKVKDLMEKKELQSLQDQDKKAEKFENVTGKQNKTIHDQEIFLQDMVKTYEKIKKQNEENLISIHKQLDELIEDRKIWRPRAENITHQLQIEEKQEIIKKLEAKFKEFNVKNKETISELNQQLQTKEKELCTERQRVRDMTNLVQRIKADIHNCSRFIKYPHVLRDNFIKLSKSYTQGTDESTKLPKELRQKRAMNTSYRIEINPTQKIVPNVIKKEQGIQAITKYRTTPPACNNDASLPDALNSFYRWFETRNSMAMRKTIPPPNDQALCLTTADCFKTPTIIPVPKKSSVSCLNEYCPVALIPIIMKCFKRLIIRHIKTLLPPSLDPLQFACHHNRSTHDAIATTLLLALSYLDKKDTYFQMLFIDFSSAFNTIIAQQLMGKLSLLVLNTSLCNWILDFLTERPQSGLEAELLAPPY
ncbi:cilia- and flagella-associated protein 57-like [Neoarius graeffei]|uniref:cilia- and flagella-associated protein 57-like n=1 Tax=Neoarius graeffei TaxID=443677 RepID=UPI00298C00C4|nr:cilia- and flagella-associated protein 57-like [Neoarius graeffei]